MSRGNRWQFTLFDMALSTVAAIFVLRASWTQQFTTFPSHIETTLAAFCVALCFYRGSTLRMVTAAIAGAVLSVFLAAAGYFLTGFYYVYVQGQHIVNGVLMLEEPFLEEVLGWAIIACTHVPESVLAGAIVALLVKFSHSSQ